jgi:hypothetical protein
MVYIPREVAAAAITLMDRAVINEFSTFHFS